MKLCLGTAQFGLDYGVRGGKQPSLEKSTQMLEKAVFDYNILTFDTAAAYGNAEVVLGNFFNKNQVCKNSVSVITKLSPGALNTIDESKYKNEIIIQTENSLSRLNLEKLNGLLLHNAKDIFNDKIIISLASIKTMGLADNVGVSIYEPEEALAAAKNEYIDYIQVPYNAFDQRLEKVDFFKIAKQNNKTIFARSAFLQGLLVMEETPSHLVFANAHIRKFQNLCKKYGLSYSDACINYVLSNEYIDFIVMGIDDVDEIEKNINAIKISPNLDFASECKINFCNTERKIIIPSLWKEG